ncbi:unnamed protein product [Rhodiola kirilowii]
MTLLNLIIFEDGHLNALSPLLVYLSGASADSFQGNLDETQSIRKSSHLVALKFQKIQTFFSSSQSSPRLSTNIVSEDSDDEACTTNLALICNDIMQCIFYCRA